MQDLLTLRNDAIWLPGRGMLRLPELQAARAVEEYDASLVLGQRKDSGEWVVFIKDGPNGQPFPALGLGHQLPSPERIKQLLYEKDTVRHGGEIVRKIERHNQKVRDKFAAKSSDGAGAAAEAFVWGAQQMGALPKPIFVPKGV